MLQVYGIFRSGNIDMSRPRNIYTVTLVSTTTTVALGTCSNYFLYDLLYIVIQVSTCTAPLQYSWINHSIDWCVHMYYRCVYDSIPNVACSTFLQRIWIWFNPRGSPPSLWFGLVLHIFLPTTNISAVQDLNFSITLWYCYPKYSEIQLQLYCTLGN